MADFEDEYMDVLQNIEFAIVSTYREHTEMCDCEVMNVLEALIDKYKGEKIGRGPRDFNLTQLEQILRDAVHETCEWRLGRSETTGDLPATNELDVKPITPDEIILCLKRIFKSVKMWNREGGRQGYLHFVVQFVK